MFLLAVQQEGQCDAPVTRQMRCTYALCSRGELRCHTFMSMCMCSMYLQVVHAHARDPKQQALIYNVLSASALFRVLTDSPPAPAVSSLVATSCTVLRLYTELDEQVCCLCVQTGRLAEWSALLLHLCMSRNSRQTTEGLRFRALALHTHCCHTKHRNPTTSFDLRLYTKLRTDAAPAAQYTAASSDCKLHCLNHLAGSVRACRTRSQRRSTRTCIVRPRRATWPPASCARPTCCCPRSRTLAPSRAAAQLRCAAHRCTQLHLTIWHVLHLSTPAGLTPLQRWSQ